MEKDRLYSKMHIWVSLDGDRARIGITEHAQERLGSIMFLNLPDEGEELNIGERFGDIESIKTVSDLISPINGTVTGVNEELVDEPGRINEDPYESWMIEAEVSQMSKELMDEGGYLSYKDNP